MKYVFLVLALMLSILAYLNPLITGMDQDNDEILIWVTDQNPERYRQIRQFYQWRNENDLPDVQVKLDHENNFVNKKIIQGVIGVGGDLFETFGIDTIRKIKEVGIVEDVSRLAQEKGFGLDKTYTSLKYNIIVDGEQIGFPANVATLAFFVNNAQIKKVGMSPVNQSTFSDWETFIAWGKEYIEKANRGLELQQHYLFAQFTRDALNWTFGAEMYNETLTDTVFQRDSDKWHTFFSNFKSFRDELNFIPTPAVKASFSSQYTYGGNAYSLFEQGNYVFYYGNRANIIGLRLSDIVKGVEIIDNRFFPFPSTPISARTVQIYAGSKQKQLAADFLAFLASEEYNLSIIESGDGMPPNPEYLKHPEYLRPADHPDEWGMHEVFASDQVYQIAETYSPYINPVNSRRVWITGYGEFIHDRHSAQDAIEMMEETADKFFKDFETSASEAELADYEKWQKIQKQLDERLEKGQKIPSEWVRSSFWLAWYEHKNLLE